MSRPALTVGGYDIVLAARCTNGDALVSYADKQGKPTDRFRIAAPHELRGIGWHMAEIKAAIAGLHLIEFPWEAADARGGRPSAGRGAVSTPAGGGFLHAHHALPTGDR